MPLRDYIQPLLNAGVSYRDAEALRRISMTLHRWHELECGDGNAYGSWAIERETDEPDSRPFLVHHHYAHGAGKDRVTRTLIRDRETGALKRLKQVMAGYPTLSYYVQGDPRGEALFILRPGDVPEGKDADSYYSRGIAVHK